MKSCRIESPALKATESKDAEKIRREADEQLVTGLAQHIEKGRRRRQKQIEAAQKALDDEFYNPTTGEG